MTGEKSKRRERAQLVLAAAALVAVALAPVVVAYLQLGYHADVTASEGYDAPDRNAERVLTRAVHDATADVPAEYAWDERELAVAAVRAALEPRLDALRSARVESGTVYQVAYNQFAADEWQEANCPYGPNRQFGACEARRGVVVQERANRTHALAVAFDVWVTTDDSAIRTSTESFRFDRRRLARPWSTSSAFALIQLPEQPQYRDERQHRQQ